MAGIVFAVARQIGLPGCMILGILAFYEGAPIGPLRLIPFLGPVLEIVTDGRVDRERKAGAMAERQTWEDLRRREGLARERERQEAQAKIDSIESEYWRQRQLQSFKISELEKALAAEPEANPSCACPPAVSERLRNIIDAAGR